MTPATVADCGIFQLAEVNVKLAGKTVPSEASPELKSIITFAAGSELRTIVNVAIVPLSVVFPLIAETVIPAISSSVFVTETSSTGLLL